jgi:hypothetical protein
MVVAQWNLKYLLTARRYLAVDVTGKGRGRDRKADPVTVMFSGAATPSPKYPVATPEVFVLSAKVAVPSPPPVTR